MRLVRCRQAHHPACAYGIAGCCSSAKADTAETGQARTAATAGGGSNRPVGYDPSCGNNCIRCHGTDSPWRRDSLHSGSTLFAGGSQSV